jgi:hypothetical protein
MSRTKTILIVEERIVERHTCCTKKMSIIIYYTANLNYNKLLGTIQIRLL